MILWILEMVVAGWVVTIIYGIIHLILGAIWKALQPPEQEAHWNPPPEPIVVRPQAPKSFLEEAVSHMNPESIKVHRRETVDRFPDGRVVARKEETIIVEGYERQPQPLGVHLYYGPGRGGSGPASFYKDAPPELWENIKKQEEQRLLAEKKKRNLWGWQ